MEFRKVLTSGNSKPMLVVGREPDGGTAPIVLKLMNPAVDQGHAGPTSLACELICAVLARTAGLTVPDYGIATVTREFAESAVDREVRTVLLANIGPNFATRYLGGRSVWIPSYSPRGDLLARLEGVLTFDCTLVNGDRTAKKPNLLWDGDDVVLIDHSLALPVYAWSPQEVADSPAMPERHVRKHAAYPALRDQGQRFKDLLDSWTNIPWADVAAIRSWIPTEWERRTGDLDRIFEFLGSRHRRFNDISMDLTRIVK